MKKINHLVQFILVSILFFIFRILGFKLSSNLGFAIGRTLGPLFRSKKLIIKNLDKAGIKKNQIKIASNVLGNYGRIFAEYVHLINFKNNKLKKFISVDGIEYLEDIKNHKKKVVFVTGHFNNFELVPIQLEKSGIDCSIIYRAQNNKYLNNTMEKIRNRDNRNIKMIKKGGSGTKELLSSVKKGKSIALAIDQRVREGIKIPFFNHSATTTTIPSHLIKKYGYSVAPIYIERYEKNYFKMYVSKPIKIDKKKTQNEITIFLNKILEKMILKNVDQWIWTHDRWKN